MAHVVLIGSSISASGLANVTSNSKINPLPSWECLINGISTGSMAAAAINLEQGWSFCTLYNIPDGFHELVINIISDGVVPFYVEYLTYTPSLNVSQENSLVVIDGTDPAINYISGWTGSQNAPGSISVSGSSQMTNLNSLVNVTFVGTQLSWYAGNVDPNETISLGEYSVDKKSFTSFQIQANTKVAEGQTIFFLLLFITSSLEMSTHVLSV
ncbi:hypothetical protein Clacol_010224 [Clathrus columnatus]|uniref:Uncharacterized protein n=1 Tax=Clathrus columnatus TaxID=1419009 RepID=A0AAV5ANB1_9AGAM|nr:hypothetical protein Clacol_010224 [Clathrus columnatus]